MDLRLLASTFVAVFLAELGDKTQLATLSLSAGSSSRLSVFVGSALALVTTSLLAVVGGEVLTRFVSPIVIRRLAGAVFLIFGALYLFSRSEP